MTEEEPAQWDCMACCVVGVVLKEGCWVGVGGGGVDNDSVGDCVFVSFCYVRAGCCTDELVECIFPE